MVAVRMESAQRKAMSLSQPNHGKTLLPAWKYANLGIAQKAGRQARRACFIVANA